ncbi:MAG: DNA translocase FtsK, partial [Gemmatimonadales bacterium]
TLLPVPVTGSMGQSLGVLLLKIFGAGAWFLPILGVGWALAAFGRLGALSVRGAAVLGAGLMLLVPYGIGIATGASATAFPADYAAWDVAQRAVGLVPAFLASGVRSAIGTAGGTLVGLVALSAVGVASVGWHPFVALRARAGGRGTGEEVKEPVVGRGRRETVEEAESEEDPAPIPRPFSPDRARKPKPALPPVAPAPPEGSLIPPLELLRNPPPGAGDADAEQIGEMGRRLVATLETFRVGGQIADKTVGPVVTRFELTPGPGVKVGRIASLADDLALAMKARSLRIVAPIPGKARVGIEVPNPHARIVTIRELIENARFRTHGSILPVALGRDLEGQEVYADLARMPHLLIAGVTGSGKSVCINTLITSLVYAHPPETLKLLMIDPKMVELSMYKDLPHLGLAVVTSHKKAASVVKWAVEEMEQRYRLLHANAARNIGDFNRKVTDGKPLRGPRETLAGAGGTKDTPFEDWAYQKGVLPYIVLVVDELADLMLTVQGEIETPLAVLAQKARAIGIHLILATQRPSVNVITGLIKANFPCRIAFRVSAKVDSRTILDQNGAETLLGNGDMLFLPPGKSEPQRVQGAFIATDETERLMDWYRAHTSAQVVEKAQAVIEGQVAAIQAADKPETGGEGGEPGERDPLFRQAAEVCIQNQLGSTSLLQRRMSIGYGRAARIIDQLEMAGILGPANGSKPRDVLVGLEELDEIGG